MSNIILFKNFDVSKISYDALSKNARGGNRSYLKYNGVPKLILQTPVVYAPFGLSKFEEEGKNKYSIDISFRGMDEDPKIKLYHDKMAAFDNELIAEGVKNSKDWFGKKLTQDTIENFYKSIVKPSKEPTKYAPTQKFKIENNRDGSPAVEVYNAKKERMDIQDIPKGAQLSAIIEARQVWFMNKNSYGVSWRLVQLMLQKSDKLSGYSFLEDSDNDDSEAEYEEESEEEEVPL